MGYWIWLEIVKMDWNVSPSLESTVNGDKGWKYMEIAENGLNDRKYWNLIFFLNG